MPVAPDLPLPEPLSAAAAKDADELVQLIGPYASACLLSKTWQLRVAALQARGPEWLLCIGGFQWEEVVTDQEHQRTRQLLGCPGMLLYSLAGTRIPWTMTSAWTVYSPRPTPFRFPSQWLEAGAGRAPGLLADPDNFGLLARTLSAALHDRVAAAYLAALPALLLLAQCQVCLLWRRALWSGGLG